MKKIYDTSKITNKPAPFIAPLSDIKVTKEEMEKRKRKYNRLQKLGIEPTLIIDNEEETENPYMIQAMVYISKDEDVPKELLKKIKQYDKEHGINRTETVNS